MTYTVWEGDDEPGLFMLVQGEQLSEQHKQTCPPMHLVWTFDAISPNDAMRKYYDWQGWGPYQPMRDADGNVYPEDEEPFPECNPPHP